MYAQHMCGDASCSTVECRLILQLAKAACVPRARQLIFPAVLLPCNLGVPAAVPPARCSASSTGVLRLLFSCS